MRMSARDPSTPPAEAAKWRIPDLHPEGRKYVLTAGIVALIALVWFGWFLAWPLIALTVWVALFFRDPVRVTPGGDDVVVAPADGLVSMIERVPVPRELAGPGGLGDAPLVRISVFMSVFDVHINRAPIAGTIRQLVYISGKFVNAELDKASEDNERQHIVVEGRNGRRVGMTQIAGLLARRIVPFVKPGDMVAGGQRIGLIRFGSRVDVYLPENCVCQVVLGQRSVAGETILGRVGGAVASGIAQ